MKIYISVDIEGITGVTSWNETDINNMEYRRAKDQMNREALGAVKGALAGGAKEIYIKDAHETGRNLDIDIFPREVKIIRDWTGEPVSMLGLLDESFDGIIYIGYHSGSYEDGNPLAHTISNSKINYIKINGEIASEFTLNNLWAREVKVPSIFLSGDKNICERAREIDKDIRTFPVKEGIGGASVDLAPSLAVEEIERQVKEAVLGLKDWKDYDFNLPDKFQVEISYKDHRQVLKASYYPGVKKINSRTVAYEASSVLELMTTRMFIM